MKSSNMMIKFFSMTKRIYTIKVHEGLCNRIRFLYSHYGYAEANNYNMNVIWEIDDACPGFYLDYFQALPNVSFLKNNFRNLDIHEEWHTNSQMHSSYLPVHNGYNKLVPIDSIQKKINYKKEILGDYIAIHVRRTDHESLAKKKKCYNDLSKFTKYIDNFNNSKNLYIATDNQETYSFFQDKYSDLVKFDYHKSNPKNFRHTSLEDAVMDLFVCSDSSYFLGTDWSSFSGFIEQKIRDRQINKDRSLGLKVTKKFGSFTRSS